MCVCHSSWGLSSSPSPRYHQDFRFFPGNYAGRGMATSWLKVWLMTCCLLTCFCSSLFVCIVIWLRSTRGHCCWDWVPHSFPVIHSQLCAAIGNHLPSLLFHCWDWMQDCCRCQKAVSSLLCCQVMLTNRSSVTTLTATVQKAVSPCCSVQTFIPYAFFNAAWWFWSCLVSFQGFFSIL